MPLIEIKYFEQEFTDDERSEIIRAVTDAMVTFTGEAIRPHTWIVISEVRDGNWGIGGNALGLSDVRALQAAESGQAAAHEPRPPDEPDPGQPERDPVRHE